MKPLNLTFEKQNTQAGLPHACRLARLTRIQGVLNVTRPCTPITRLLHAYYTPITRPQISRPNACLRFQKVEFTGATNLSLRIDTPMTHLCVLQACNRRVVGVPVWYPEISCQTCQRACMWKTTLSLCWQTPPSRDRDVHSEVQNTSISSPSPKDAFGPPNVV